MPSHTAGPFVLDYNGYEMNWSTLNGTSLRNQLRKIISESNKVGMDTISHHIFELIIELGSNENLYALSIALTNYYFESFWSISWERILDGKTKTAEEIIMWSCENVWRAEVSTGYTFHKGTPYFFLGMCYMINGNIDLAFQMIHNGHTENLTTYPLLESDYKTAPSYLFICLDANNPHNAMLDWVLAMKKKIEEFIDNHNQSSSTPLTYKTFDKKFLQRVSKSFDETKFFLVYLLMNLLNLDSLDKKFLTNNAFSNIRKIELMFCLCLIVDKTLAEKYRTFLISEGVIQYFVQMMSISENNVKKLSKALRYSDGTQFNIRGNPEDVISRILSDDLTYRGNTLSYNMKCMLAAWYLRNFSAHNLSGIDKLLTDEYQSILIMLFSALFFATEIL